MGTGFMNTLHTLIKTNNNPQLFYSLWRRTNARHMSFQDLSRWYFDLQQLVWKNQISMFHSESPTDTAPKLETINFCGGTTQFWSNIILTDLLTK